MNWQLHLNTHFFLNTGLHATAGASLRCHTVNTSTQIFKQERRVEYYKARVEKQSHNISTSLLKAENHLTTSQR